MTSDVNDNREKSRFELTEGQDTVIADYHINDKTLYIDYVESPTALRGTGAAGRLMEGIMSQAAKDGLAVVPVCGYASAWMRRHRAL